MPHFFLTDLQVGDEVEIITVLKDGDSTHASSDTNSCCSDGAPPTSPLQCVIRQNPIRNKINNNKRRQRNQRHPKLKNECYRKRLSDLGLIPGTKIKILRKAVCSGPIEIHFRGATLVIGRGLANKIQVKKIS